MRTLLILICLSQVVGAAPRHDTTDLFTAKTGGYTLYRIPVFVVAPGGSLVALCEARMSGGDWGNIDLLMRRSADGGHTWEEARVIVKPPADVKRSTVALEQKLGKPDSIVVGNPVAIADHTNKALHILYCVEYARCFYVRSDDDGKTFSEPVEITGIFESFKPNFPWRVIATGPGHAIQSSKGRLVVPIWLSTGEGGHGHRPSCVATIYSDDSGKTWNAGEIVVDHPDLINPSESTVVELSDGRIMINIRHEGPNGKKLKKDESTLRATFVSPDGATNWGGLRLDAALAEPICMGSLLRLPGDKPVLLFSNPDNPKDRRRRNLTVKLSENDGMTWPIKRVIDPEISGYSDLGCSPDGKTLYCFYERGSTTDERHNDIAALTLVRFNLEWLRGTGESR